MSSWDDLGLELQREAEEIFRATGEIILVAPRWLPSGIDPCVYDAFVKGKPRRWLRFQNETRRWYRYLAKSRSEFLALCPVLSLFTRGFGKNRFHRLRTLNWNQFFQPPGNNDARFVLRLGRYVSRRSYPRK